MDFLQKENLRRAKSGKGWVGGGAGDGDGGGDAPFVRGGWQVSPPKLRRSILSPPPPFCSGQLPQTLASLRASRRRRRSASAPGQRRERPCAGRPAEPASFSAAGARSGESDRCQSRPPARPPVNIPRQPSLASRRSQPDLHAEVPAGDGTEIRFQMRACSSLAHRHPPP